MVKYHPTIMKTVWLKLWYTYIINEWVLISGVFSWMILVFGIINKLFSYCNLCTFWRWPHIFCWNQGLSKNPRMWVYRTPHSCSPWRIGIKWGNAPFSGTATQQHQQRWIEMGFQPRGDCFFFRLQLACQFCLSKNIRVVDTKPSSRE